MKLEGVVSFLSLLSSLVGLEMLRLGSVRDPGGVSSSLGDARCGGEVVLRLEVLHVACAAPWTRARADRGSPSSPSFEPVICEFIWAVAAVSCSSEAPRARVWLLVCCSKRFLCFILEFSSCFIYIYLYMYIYIYI